MWLIIALFCLPLSAAQETFVFESSAQQETYLQLTKELRCPMCQNQNIADSDAVISHDMRRKVYQLLQEGKSEAEVIAFMKQRYGDFVHYQPPVTFGTVWLWVGPLAFLLLAGWFVVMHQRRKKIQDVAQQREQIQTVDKLLNG